MSSASFQHAVHQYIEGLKTIYNEDIICYPGSAPTRSLHLKDNVFGEMTITIYFPAVVEMYGALREGQDVIDTPHTVITCVINCTDHDISIVRTSAPIDTLSRWDKIAEALIIHTMNHLDEERAEWPHIISTKK